MRKTLLTNSAREKLLRRGTQFRRTMGWPAEHPNAFWNSGMFDNHAVDAELAREECGSVCARSRENSGLRLSHHTCAKPRKKRWGALNPSRAGGSLPPS